MEKGRLKTWKSSFQTTFFTTMLSKTAWKHQKIRDVGSDDNKNGCCGHASKPSSSEE